MLINNQLESLYGGVNQQAPEHRNDTQVDEMINAYPTINSGLLKRNPSTRVELDYDIDYTDEAWLYEYDRGLTGDGVEEFSIQVYATNNDGESNDKVDMRIIDVNSGQVYTGDNGGIIYDDESKDYLNPFIDKNGYAATTVKDTTFIVNKNIIPELKPNDYSTEAAPVDVDAIWNSIEIKRTSRPMSRNKSSGGGGFASSPSWATISSKFMNGANKPSNLAPCSIYVYTRSSSGSGSDIDFYGASITLTVDDVPIEINTDTKKYRGRQLTSYSSCTNNDGYESCREVNGYDTVRLYESFSEYRARVYSIVSSQLNQSLYRVEYKDDYTNTSLVPLRITRLDGNPIEISVSATFTNTMSIMNSRDYQIAYTPNTNDYFGTVYGSGTTPYTYTPSPSDADKDAFIWIKTSNPSSPYNYTYSLNDADGNEASGTVSGSSTTDVASNMVSHINTNHSDNYSATSSGSIVKVTALNADMATCDSSDDFGSVASFSWVREVQSTSDLPKSLGFTGALVNVVGSGETGFDDFWLKYDGSQWKESISPKSLYRVEPSTMPHILVRNADNTFTLKEYDGWLDMAVGDSTTNPVPSIFKQTEQQTSPSIKDIFFFKNRLGFITSKTVLFSEVGVYGNFFRTTVATLLDSDPIDTAINTTKAIDLEFATYLETSIMLFSDKAQFRISGGDVLSPKSIQATQVSSYEINKNVRPIYMNDRLFFASKRGNHSAIFEYYISDNIDKSEAGDITAHVQTYIDADIVKMTSSPVNNMLFITSSQNTDTVYVYKYYDTNNERVQSAWFKWTFNGYLYNAFCQGKNLYLMIKRNESIVLEDWIVADGIWDGSKIWDDDLLWIGSSDDLSLSNQIESLQVAPQDYTGRFIDDDRYVEDTNSIDSLYYNGTPTVINTAVRDGFSIPVDSDLSVAINVDILSGSFDYVITSNLNTYTGTISESTEVEIPKNYIEQITSIEVYPTVGIATEGYLLGVDVADSLYNGDFSNGDYGWTIDPSWDIIFGVSGTGSIIPTVVDIGEWVPRINGNKDIRGTLKIKTAKISSELDSSFELSVKNIHRGTDRKIESKYTVDRNPMIYGDSKHIRLAIQNNDEKGFRINTVSLEGNYNTRSRRA